MMSVEPLSDGPDLEGTVPEWLRRPGGFTSADLDRLPALPPTRS
jgi:hypothetical protein